MSTFYLQNPIASPEIISRFKKERHLRQMTEDQFRDEVIRPLFFRQKLKDGRDTCGVNEKGRDAIFISFDPLGIKEYYVVQTKRGNLNLSSKSNVNVTEAITQLRTAKSAHVTDCEEKRTHLPGKAFLCISGKINDSARSHIIETLKDEQVIILDADDLIPKIDQFMPELWLGCSDVGIMKRALLTNIMLRLWSLVQLSLFKVKLENLILTTENLFWPCSLVAI